MLKTDQKFVENVLGMLDKTLPCCIRSVLYVLKPAKHAGLSVIDRFVNLLTPGHFLGRISISRLLCSVPSQRLYRGLTRRSKQKAKASALCRQRLANGAFQAGTLDSYVGEGQPVSPIFKRCSHGHNFLHQIGGYDTLAAHLYCGSEPSSQFLRRTILSQLPPVSTMKANSQQPSERGDAIPALNAAVEDLKVAEKASSIPPAKAVLGSVIVLLTLVRVRLLLFRYDLLLVHVQLGLDGQQTGSR